MNRKDGVAFLRYAGRHCQFLLDCSWCLLFGFAFRYHSSKRGLMVLSSIQSLH